MAGKFFVFILMISFLAVSNCGCVKVGTYTHERVDLEMQGNRGYVTGTPKPGPGELKMPDRKVIEFEITLPGPKQQSKSMQKEKKEKRPVSKTTHKARPKPEKSHPKIK